MMAEEFRVLRPFEFHCQLISKGKRADGRELEEMRELKLEIDAIKTANSSSLVKLGNTSLVCGCTTQLVCKQDRNIEGDDIRIKVELPPICSSPTGYRTQNTAHLLTKTLKSILDDSQCLNLECLYNEETESHWIVDVEVICLNYDGSLLDSALIAVLSALGSLKLQSDTPTQNVHRNFEVKSIPVCSSFAIIGDHFVCDPNLEEETVAQSLISITVDTSREVGYHVNKIGGKAMSVNQLSRCISLAKMRSTALQRHIAGILSSNDSEMEYMD